jgi:hypothetical protein
MQTIKFLFAAVLTGAAIFLANLVMIEPAFAGGAKWTCNTWKIEGNQLTANCAARNGVYKRTFFWMPGFVANYNGRMVWARNGYFNNSCGPCWLSVSIDGRGDPSYNCRCRAINGSWPTTGLNLNDLSNINGNLVSPI